MLCRRQSSTSDTYSGTGLDLAPDAAARLAAARHTGLTSELQACRASLADRNQELQVRIEMLNMAQASESAEVSSSLQAVKQELESLKATRARQDKGQKALAVQAEQAKHDAHEARSEAAAAAARAKELAQDVRRISQDRCAPAP